MNATTMETYEPGRYVCVRTDGWGPRMIQLGTLSPYDHTFVIVSTAGDIVEAEINGVRRSHISEYEGQRATINSAELMPADKAAAIVGKAESMIGVPYDDLAVIDDGLECVGIIWRWLAKLAGKQHGTICSQLAVLCGQAAGYDWLCGKAQPSEVTPGMLAERPTMHPFTIG